MSVKKQPVAAKNTFTKVTSKAIIEDKCIDADEDSLKTAKERECWKLFQKMTNRGISVSYDTILRGMLTPTELRMIQKKQELENAKRNSIEETQNPVKGSNAPAAQNRDKVKNITK